MAKALSCLGVALAMLATAGCSEYLDRRDTLMLGSGEAVQTNVVTQVADPWPKVARNRNIAFSGERMAAAVRRYHCGPAAGGQGSGQGGAEGARTGGSANVTIVQGNQAPAPPAGPC